jgi:hypothetical protein
MATVVVSTSRRSAIKEWSKQSADGVLLLSSSDVARSASCCSPSCRAACAPPRCVLASVLVGLPRRVLLQLRVAGLAVL